MAELFDAQSKPPGNGDKGDDHQDRPKAVSEQALHALSIEFSLQQQFHKTERADPNALDLLGEAGYSALYQGAQSPVTSLGQIGDNLLNKADVKTNIAEVVSLLPAPQHEDFGTARWHAQQIGGGIGMILPFIATKSALSKSGLSFAARTEASVYASSKLASTANAGLVADGALTGFAYDFFLRPVEQKDAGRFWTARGEHGVAGAATFGTLTAGSVGLRHMTRPLAANMVNAPKVARVTYDATMGALPGIPAGIVNADVSARLSNGRWATGEERMQGAYTMFMAGGALSALHSIPGSDVPLGQIAREYQSRKAATDNLNSMLAERARAVKAEAPAADGKTFATAESAKLTGRGSNDQSSRTVADGPHKPGRRMGSADVEKVAKPTDVQLVVPKEHVETLRIGVDLAFKASDLNCTPRQVLEFFNFARAEGAPIKQAMLEVAKQYAGEDPHMMTLIREAYMPAKGIENRVVEGDVKLKTGEASMDQHARWGQFMQIVREMPQDTAGYVGFRHDVFRWLNENRDLHDWAKQYGEQNRYSKIAGPLDYYFGTSNLSRFVAADAKPGQPANSLPEAPVQKLVADLAPDKLPVDPKLLDVDGLVESAFRPLPLAAKALVVDPVETVRDVAPAFSDAPVRRPETAPPVEVAVVPAFLDPPPVHRAEVAPQPRRPTTALDIEMAGFELGGPGKRRIVANTIAEKIGDMTTEQFAHWLDYVYAQPPGSTTPGAMNLKQMFFKQKAALVNPDVVESYLRYKGAEVAPREGAIEIPLEQIRRFLGSPPKTVSGEMPAWMQFYVQSRISQARHSAGPEASPAAVLNDALPRWLSERIKAEYVTPGRWEGNAPIYSPKLPKAIAEQMEAARRSEPPEVKKPGPPKKEFTPPPNDVSLRIERLNEVVKIDDPVVRDRLMELGSQDHANLRNIAQKLDPAKAAPEYKELLRLILPEAQNLADVKLLLDSIFFGNKAHRNDAGSEQTKANMQLAMALAEHIVPQSNENFGRVNELIGDMITGKIRDPRPERPPGDGNGGARGGNDGRREGRSGGPSVTVQPFISPVVSPVRGLDFRSRFRSQAVETELAKAAKSAQERGTAEEVALKQQQDLVRQQLELAASLALQHAIRVANAREAELAAIRARTVNDAYLTPHQAPVTKPFHSPISSPMGRSPGGRMF